jgi:hypothetical protein
MRRPPEGRAEARPLSKMSKFLCDFDFPHGNFFGLMLQLGCLGSGNKVQGLPGN